LRQAGRWSIDGAAAAIDEQRAADIARRVGCEEGDRVLPLGTKAGKDLERPAGLPLTVDIVEPTGSESQLQGGLGRHPISGVFRMRIDTKPGETIRVSPEPGAVHLFDAQSSVCCSQ
jgi:ABC-type sugar transport system ATPase subunit